MSRCNSGNSGSRSHAARLESPKVPASSSLRRFVASSLCALTLAASSFAQPAPATRPAAHYDTVAPRNPELLVRQSLQQLQSTDWILRWQAMEDLVALKTPAAIQPLSAIVNSPKEHPWVRSRALVAMARLGGPSVLEQALSLSADKEPELRAGAVEALGILGSDRGLQIAKDRISDPSPAVQSAALIAFARIGKGAAWDAVSAGLAGVPKDAAFRAIVYVPTAAARQKIQTLLEANDTNWRRQIMAAIGESRDTQFLPALLAHLAVEVDIGNRQVGESALARFDDSALAEPLLAVLAADKSALYRVALKLLARRSTKAACDVVVSSLARIEKADPPSLPLALDLLARFDGEAYRDLAAKYLKHALPEVRCGAVAALARSRTADQFTLLRDALVDPDQCVRAAAFQSLRRNTRGAPKGGIIAYLAQPLASKDLQLVRETMGLLRDRLTRAELPQAMAALDPLLTGTDAELQQYAAHVLAAVADDEALTRLALARGFLTPWLVIGPFNFEAADAKASAMSAVYPPEKEFDLDAKYDPGRADRVNWAMCRSHADDASVDLAYVYGGRRRLLRSGQYVAYALVDVVAPNAQPVTLRVQVKGDWCLWLNGVKLPAEGAKSGPGNITSQLAKGNNRLLLKLAAGDGREWSYRVQLLDKDNHPINGLKTTVPAAPEEAAPQ